MIAIACVACAAIARLDPYDGPSEAPASGDASVAAPDTSAQPGSPRAFERTLSITSSVDIAATVTLRVTYDDAAADVASGNLRADYSNLHVIDSTTGRERERFVDAKPGGVAAVWFKPAELVPSGASTRYRLRYGDEGMPAAANAPGAFALADDFTGASPVAWRALGSPSIGSGAAVLHAGKDEAIASADTFSPPCAVEFVAQVTSGTTNVDPAAYWFGFQRAGDFDPNPNWVLLVSRVAGAQMGEADACGTGQPRCDTPSRADDDAVHTYRIERDPSTAAAAIAHFFVDDQRLGQLNTVPDSLSVMARKPTSSRTATLTSVRVWQRAFPEPQIQVGPGQPIVRD